MNEYSKNLYLPSGGLEYPPFVWLDKLKNDIKLLENDSNAYSSQFEYIMLLVKYHTKLPVDIYELLLQDFYFIWTHILLSDIFIDGDFFETIVCQEPGCRTKNKISIDFAGLDFKQYNKWNKITKKNEIISITIDNQEFIITFRHRKVKDNLDFSYLKLFYDNKNNVLFDLILYILPQVIKIEKDDKTKIEQLDYLSFFQYLRKLDIMEIYSILINFAETIGSENNVEFTCRNEKCKIKNNFLIFNDFTLSVIMPRVSNFEKAKDVYKGIFSLARYPIFNLIDVFNIPLRHEEHISKALNEIDFKAGTVMF